MILIEIINLKENNMERINEPIYLIDLKVEVLIKKKLKYFK
jgi:hypothetical protein